MQSPPKKEKASRMEEKKVIPTDAASRYAALRSHAIRLEEAIDPNAERVDKLRKQDVIFGRGKGLQKHPGNKRMRSIIDKYKVKYHASKRAEKKDLVVQVYSEIIEGGVRFLKKIDGENAWILVDEPVAMEKVSHTLRCRKLLKGTKDADIKQPPPPPPPPNNGASIPSSSSASRINPAIHPHTDPPPSLTTMNRGEMLSSIPASGTSPYLASMYGNLGGGPTAPAPSATTLGSLGTLGGIRTGTLGGIRTGPSLAHLQASSYAGLSGGYGGGLWSLPPTIPPTDMEYLALLRRQQHLQDSLLIPQAREAAMLQSARLQQLAATDRVGGLAAEEYARHLSRQNGAGNSGPYNGGGNTNGTR